MLIALLLLIVLFAFLGYTFSPFLWIVILVFVVLVFFGRGRWY